MPKKLMDDFNHKKIEFPEGSAFLDFRFLVMIIL
jgi:hypothetical protein